MAIISFILINLKTDSAVLLWGKIRYWSLLGFKGLGNSMIDYYYTILEQGVR